MQFEIYKMNPLWALYKKSQTDGHSLKNANPYEKTNSPASLARWRIKNVYSGVLWRFMTKKIVLTHVKPCLRVYARVNKKMHSLTPEFWRFVRLIFSWDYPIITLPIFEFIFWNKL